LFYGFFLFFPIHHGGLYNSWTNGIHSDSLFGIFNAVFVNPITPCLEATCRQSLKPTSPATEEQLTMVPLPCLSISEFHVACRANPFQVYGNGFIPIFLCAISRGAESPNTGIVKA
jgi:hypothetical protein